MIVNCISAQQLTGSSTQDFAQGTFSPLVILFQVDNRNTDIPTYNGVNFTYLAQIASSGMNIYVWYLYNPAQGANTYNDPSGSAGNVYVFSNVASNFTDVTYYDQNDNGNFGPSLTPTVNNGYLLFFQQARSGDTPITLTAGQGNVQGIQFGATSTYPSLGAGNNYTSTATYAHALPGTQYDGFGIALKPYVFTQPAALVIGGGGGGGAYSGGGAGGYIFDSPHTLTPQTYTVTIGAGGTAGFSGTDGIDSVFDSLDAVGGGGAQFFTTGDNGGSGAGGTRANGGTGTVGQGNNGGNGTMGVAAGGGGGGAYSVGGNDSGSGGGTGGNAGDGIYNGITNTGAYYAGGGAGGAGAFGSNGSAGSKGGNGPGANGPSNSGSGGGGYSAGSGGGATGNGGSGFVVVVWPTANFGVCSVTGMGNAITTDGTVSIATFVISGTLIIGALLNAGMFMVSD